jgi:hypothetical protein
MLVGISHGGASVVRTAHRDVSAEALLERVAGIWTRFRRGWLLAAK